MARMNPEHDASRAAGGRPGGPPSQPAAVDATSRVDAELVELTLSAVLGEFERLAELGRARAPRYDRRWREALLQVHLFGGFPRLVEAASVLARAGALGEAAPEEAALEADNHERGAELFARIYGGATERVRSSLEGFHPDLAAWVQGHVYGRVLSRPGLPAFERELLAVAALCATGQERQLASHVRGAVRLGATPAEVAEVLELTTSRLAPEALERCRLIVQRFSTPGDL